jgi:hypothetical protein
MATLIFEISWNTGVTAKLMYVPQDIACGGEDFTVPKYIEWVVANARKFEQVSSRWKARPTRSWARRWSPRCSVSFYDSRGPVYLELADATPAEVEGGWRCSGSWRGEFIARAGSGFG